MLVLMSVPQPAESATPKRNGFVTFIRSEYPLFIGLATAAIFYGTGSLLVEDLSNPLWLGVIFFWLFGTVLWSAFSVVRHADCLAIKCGEPYGTLILTLAVITIEVMMISAAMLHGANKPYNVALVAVDRCNHPAERPVPATSSSASRGINHNSSEILRLAPPVLLASSLVRV
jgi:hypothetical protein